MDERRTVRLLLFDPGGRLLLVKYDDPSVSDPNMPRDGSVFWATPGGRIEAGEDARAAALREALEETGQPVRLGPDVWYGEHVLEIDGAPILFKESFVVAFIAAEELSRRGWSESERKVIREMRWWTIDDLRRTGEIVFPAVMKELLPSIIEGQYPARAQRIEL